MIQMARRGPIVRGSDADFQAARQLFAEHHCLRLEGFIEPDFLAVLRSVLARAPFHNRTHEGIGTELWPAGHRSHWHRGKDRHAGWFRTAPDYVTMFRERHDRP
jgi:hypothetical protein